jgi:hypothetical protein
MATVFRVYETGEQVQQVVAALSAAGISREQISIIMGSANPQTSAMGNFVSGDGHDHGSDPMGSFASNVGSGHQGSFADTDGQHRHDETVGSFASVDKETMTVFLGGRQRMQVVSHNHIVQLLVENGSSQETAIRQIDAIHMGKTLLLIEVEPEGVEQMNSLLENSGMEAV